MRDIKTLLQIVVDSLKAGEKNGYMNNGICGELIDLSCKGIISIQEEHLIDNYIDKNKPHGLSDAHTGWISGYWWVQMRYGVEYRQIRIDFLTDLINKLP